jgi:RNA-directed DNA polymerase
MTISISLDLSNSLKDWRHKHKQFYDIWSIKKKHGGRRWIYAPKGELREAQEELNSCLLKREFHPAACAYLPGCSPRKALEKHLENLEDGGWLLTLDIQDFFGHITNKMLQDSDLTKIEALLCCIPHARREWVLPQGGITSPLAANLAAYKLDVTLTNWAQEHELTYTRYADDLGFSRKVDFRGIKPVKAIAQILTAHGFKIAPGKVKMQPPGSGQTYLGLIHAADGHLSVSRKYRNKARAMQYNDRCGRTTNKDVVQGVCNYIKSVNETQYFNIIMK